MGFKENIEQAKSKLEERRNELIQQIAEIDVELKDYETALRVARKLAAFVPTDSDSVQVPTTSEFGPTPTQDIVEFAGSMKDLTLEILKSRYPREASAQIKGTYQRGNGDKSLAKHGVISCCASIKPGAQELTYPLPHSDSTALHVGSSATPAQSTPLATS